MKITVCKEYTTLEYVDQVKADIKEFKARYTDGDLLRALWTQQTITPHTQAKLSSAM